MMRRLLTLGPDNEPMWVQLDVYRVGAQRHSAVVADGVPPPRPDEVKGIEFHADTSEEAERLAKAYPGLSDPAH